MSLSRRQFFTLAGTSAAGVVLMSPLEALYTRVANGQSVSGGGYGPLIPDPNGLLDLPRGFQYRAFSRTGDMMNDRNPVPGGHDGMAAFPGPNNTTILVRNHELSPNSTTQVAGLKYDNLCKGGTTTLIVGPDRQLKSHYASLAGTYRNCAGGPTPWGSWISCEENTSTPATNDPVNTTGNVEKRHGYNFEVPANAKRNVVPVPLRAMGRFNHEAVAVDPKTGIVYETEDRGDSLFYRFIPNQPGNLVAGGVLEALKIKGMPQAITKTNFPVRKPMAVEWVRIDNPDPDTDTFNRLATPESTRAQGFSKGAAQFTRGEGIWYGKGEFYFCCTDGGEKELGQVWRYVPGTNAQEGGTLELFVEPNNENVLEGPDNIVVAPFGDLILCEDGDDEQFVVGVTQKGELYQFARNAINDREFAGACFSPDGQTMFVNIQTPGITFAIWGPWARG
ncbi:PhoX family protein [Funiculus sociatus GB2-A5]|uniref:PhoX family protein n=1 Tax=Funiculus sociatus GB2-A5 TaxID=2933946 RepID=A0ABV0JNQ7_9CYAN|nr:alkaline phosphatase PhoX [Trichocoleus sp. FACHB-6]MBD2062733.1 DUF839 domain-containing protein [Trichocoleus sp. FACHB-6]